MRAVRSLIALAFLLCTITILVPFGILTLGIDRRQRMHDWFSARCSGIALGIAGLRIEVEGLANVVSGERYLVVANHQSLLDTPLLLDVLQRRTPIRFVAKRSMFRVPILGWGMRRFGHIAVDRRSVWSSLTGLRQARAGAGGRYSFVLFAEGTRSRDGRMRRFGAAAFKVASHARISILPVTIDGTYDALPAGRLILRSPATARVTIHAPLPPPDDDAAHVRAAALACQTLIADALPVAKRPVSELPLAPTDDSATG